jgi:hypothetical protein
MEPQSSLSCSQELGTDPYPVPDESSPASHLLSLRSILILSLQLSSCLQHWLLPSGFPTKIVHASVLQSMRSTRSAHLILHNTTTLIIFGEMALYPRRLSSLWNSSFRNFLQFLLVDCRLVVMWWDCHLSTAALSLLHYPRMIAMWTGE